MAKSVIGSHDMDGGQNARLTRFHPARNTNAQNKPVVRTLYAVSFAMDLTPTEIAKRLKKRRSYVVSLIESGRLRAYDVTEPKAKYKSYRVTEDALREFQERAQVKRPVAAKRRNGLPEIESIV